MAKSKSSERRKAQRAREALGRGLLREAGLDHLKRATKNPLPKRLLDAAHHVHFLWQDSRGHMATPGFAVERVDTSPRGGAAIVAGALDAERELRRLFRESNIGEEATLTVLAICCEGMTVSAYAMEIEEDAAARSMGSCNYQTLDRVRWLLRSGLEGISNVMHLGGPDSAVGPLRAKMRAWLLAPAGHLSGFESLEPPKDRDGPSPSRAVAA